MIKSGTVRSPSAHWGEKIARFTIAGKRKISSRRAGYSKYQGRPDRIVTTYNLHYETETALRLRGRTLSKQREQVCLSACPRHDCKARMSRECSNYPFTSAQESSAKPGIFQNFAFVIIASKHKIPKPQTIHQLFERHSQPLGPSNKSQQVRYNHEIERPWKRIMAQIPLLERDRAFLVTMAARAFGSGLGKSTASIDSHRGASILVKIPS